MKKLILVALLLPSLATAAEAPKKKAAPANPCAQYGPDFVQIKGSNTCVKIGGYIRIDIGR
jgi:hypothetical protein